MSGFAVNVKFAQRYVCPFPWGFEIAFLVCPFSRLREITSDLPACGLSRMASCSIRVRERGSLRGKVGMGETGMASFIIRGGIFAMPVRRKL